MDIFCLESDDNEFFLFFWQKVIFGVEGAQVHNRLVHNFVNQFRSRKWLKLTEGAVVEKAYNLKNEFLSEIRRGAHIDPWFLTFKKFCEPGSHFSEPGGDAEAG